MSHQLLLTARQQAERSGPAVRAAALMRIARVLARTDQAAAEQLLEQGIALSKEVDGPAASLLLGNAVYLAAAVSSKHALPLCADHRRIDPFGGAVAGLVNAMAQHGHIDDAIHTCASHCRETAFHCISSTTWQGNAATMSPG
jgi:hypothetical protein